MAPGTPDVGSGTPDEAPGTPEVAPGTPEVASATPQSQVGATEHVPAPASPGQQSVAQAPALTALSPDGTHETHVLCETSQTPTAQSASAAHDVLHAVAPQMYGVQGVVAAVLHAPEPLHDVARVSTPEVHDAAAPHDVLLPG